MGVEGRKAWGGGKMKKNERADVRNVRLVNTGLDGLD
jgi:hypothetical protein